MRILAVDDEEAVRQRLEKALRAEKFEVTSCSTGEEALSLFREGSFDVILLDIGLPGMDGFEVLRILREQGVATPVLMLTGQDSEESTVEGLSSGADDYIGKPFSVKELTARIKAAHRRATWSAQALRTVGPLELNLEDRTVRLRDKSTHLTEKEFSLLWTLSHDPIRPWTRQELLHEIWRIDFDPGTKVMDVHLSNLRRKLKKLESVEIEFDPGRGYLLNVHSD